VNKYINPMLKNDSISMKRKLRAVPHAVLLPTHGSDLSRVWYGRMVLPPDGGYSEFDDKTHGEIRSILANYPDEDIPKGFGCSSREMKALNNHRQANECEAGTIQCWARCMSLSEYNVDPDECNSLNFQLQVIFCGSCLIESFYLLIAVSFDDPLLYR